MSAGDSTGGPESEVHRSAVRLTQIIATSPDRLEAKVMKGHRDAECSENHIMIRMRFQEKAGIAHLAGDKNLAGTSWLAGAMV